MICATKVIEGADQTAPASRQELEQMADRLPRRLQGPTARLACRLHVVGEGVVLEKLGVLPPETGQTV
jgi:hypothetical protein